MRVTTVVDGHNTSRLLTTMLKCVQSKVREVGGFGVSVHSDNATFVMEVVVEIVGKEFVHEEQISQVEYDEVRIRCCSLECSTDKRIAETLMKMNLTQRVVCSPEALWPWLTDPAKMNAWSLARIEGVACGDLGRFDTVGTWRRVLVRGPLGEQVLDEAVCVTEWPRRFEYRVVPDAMVMSHRGVITLERDGDETVVHWTVEMVLAFRSLESVAVHIVKPQLAKSLQALAKCAHRALHVDCPYIDFVDDDPQEAESVARATLAEQRLIADQLDHADDPRRWFTRLYAFTTEAILRAYERGDVVHRAWVLRLVPQFHKWYFDNLARDRKQSVGEVEPHWVEAFGSMRKGTPQQRFMNGLRASVQAHIEVDLPRALSEVYQTYYRKRCDYARFQGDYLMLQRALEEPAVQFLPLVPRGLLPWGFRVAERVTPESIRRFVRIRDRYDVPTRRREAFARGALLCW
jgi:hypothetical protein